jgi:predicted nicotinamide N-methyase
LLDEYAPLGPAPLVSEVMVFQGKVLLELWSAAERVAGTALGPPFWGYPWPGGIALARLLLDRPELVVGARVLDLGTGGGVAALAAARAGAASVVANDRDPWALATARLAAERQGLALDFLLAEITEVPGVDGAAEVDESLSPSAARELPAPWRGHDVILCADLAYERRFAPRIRAFLEAARAGGARVLVADAGRAYFDETGCTLRAEYLVPVPRDLEGTESRAARVYLLD